MFTTTRITSARITTARMRVSVLIFALFLTSTFALPRFDTTSRSTITASPTCTTGSPVTIASGDCKLSCSFSWCHCVCFYSRGWGRGYEIKIQARKVWGNSKKLILVSRDHNIRVRHPNSRRYIYTVSQYIVRCRFHLGKEVFPFSTRKSIFPPLFFPLHPIIP